MKTHDQNGLLNLTCLAARSNSLSCSHNSSCCLRRDHECSIARRTLSSSLITFSTWCKELESTPSALASLSSSTMVSPSSIAVWIESRVASPWCLRFVSTVAILSGLSETSSSSSCALSCSTSSVSCGANQHTIPLLKICQHNRLDVHTSVDTYEITPSQDIHDL